MSAESSRNRSREFVQASSGQGDISLIYPEEFVQASSGQGDISLIYPESLRRTPYHAGLSLIYTPRVCGGPPTTQVYLSFTPRKFAEDPLPRRFISHLQPFRTASKFVQHTRQAGISLTSL